MLTRDEKSHGLRRVRYALKSSGVDLDRSNPRLAGIHTRGFLPHVKVEGAEYFVTFRLADSLPQEVLQQYEQERLAQIAEAKDIPKREREAEANREMRRKIEKYLDKGVGQCYLRQPAVANIVASALPFFHNQRYLLGEWVIMPNHVHVMIRPLPNYLLGDILQSLKRFTSREVNKILHRTGQTLGNLSRTITGSATTPNVPASVVTFGTIR
jgi:hypothetical protein